MQRHLLRATLATLLAGVSLTGQARADNFNLSSDNGPIQLQVAPDGSVSGLYPQYNGTLIGRVDKSGDIQGIWLQPTSDHPCKKQLNGTYSWGYFVMSSPYHKHITSTWGYCAEQPAHDWDIEHE